MIDHPEKLVVTLSAGTFIAAWAIYHFKRGFVVVKGGLRTYTRQADPAMFWLWIAIAGMVSAFLYFVAFRLATMGVSATQ